MAPRFLMPSNVAKSSGMAILGVLLASCSALGLGSSPNLSANDLPMDYTLVEDARPTLLPLCRGENVVERYGSYEVQRSFDPGDEISLIGFVVVKATDDRVWETLRSEAMDCSPDSDGFASGDVAMVADFSVEPTEGPKMGDESIWLTTSSSITSSVTDSSSSESPALLVRSGDFVMWLSGFDGMPQGDLEEYARAALD